jgi:hypothetical protein
LSKQKNTTTARQEALSRLPAHALKTFDEIFAHKIRELVLWLDCETKDRRMAGIFTQLEQDQETFDGAKRLQRRIDSDISVLHDFLEKVEALCRDIWESLRETTTSDFVCGVLHTRICGFIATHEEVIRKQIQIVGPTNGVGNLRPVFRHFDAKYSVLKHQFESKCEAEALTLKYQESKIAEKSAVLNRAHKAAAQLTPREARIWAIIQRGLKSHQYCRELENGGIRPRKSGTWKGCQAGTYLAAYQLGQPWRHRIQDEKTKIKRKALALKLVSE